LLKRDILSSSTVVLSGGSVAVASMYALPHTTKLACLNRNSFSSYIESCLAFGLTGKITISSAVVFSDGSGATMNVLPPLN